ncbi:MAG: branched-chain amino acid ABC transporter substrate-binding protein, partial [Chloroflexota bacterium]|nr:branched-chain amino acid ABC transporter substrate-binding protein [Chloroflexota bacterium]
VGTAGAGAVGTAGAVATTAAGAAGGGQTGGTIKLYSSFPRTGANKSQTDSVVNSIKLALEEAGNKAGNFTLAYEDLDDGSPAKSGNWDAAVEAANANKVTADPDAMVYIATFNSGAAKVSIPITNQANLGMISPANTYTGLTKNVRGAVEANEPEVYYPTGKRNYCRVIPTDDLQGAVGATYVKELGAKKVYILDDSELYGRGLAGVFAEAAKKLGLEVVGPESIDPQATDYRSLAQKVRSANADMIYFGGITGNNAGKLWKDMRSVLGRDFRMMGPDGIFDGDFLDAAAEAAEGTYITFGGLPPEQLTGKGAEWYKRYKDKYKSEPEAYAAYGYEAATVAIDAIRRAGRKDRAAIRDAMLATKDWNGVLGTWSFTETGDTTLTKMSINQVRNGKFEYVKTLEAARV